MVFSDKVTKSKIDYLCCFPSIPSFQILTTNILLCCSVLPMKIKVITGKIIIQHILLFYNTFMLLLEVLIISKARGHTFVTTGLEVCSDE